MQATINKNFLGQVVVTRAINDTIADSASFTNFIFRSLGRFMRKDWGDLCADDKQLNDDALETGNDRLYARYNNNDGEDILIVTEWDRSYTTIMFRSEY